MVDTYLESVGVGIEPSMRMLAGSSHWDLRQVFEHGWHHLTQDLKTVARIGPELLEKGIQTMLEKTNLDVSTIKCFLLNVPTKHLMDICLEIVRRDLKNPNLPFYTKLSARGYQGAPAIIVALDDFVRETELGPPDRILSFVTESSKWMHAGFILEYC